MRTRSKLISDLQSDLNLSILRLSRQMERTSRIFVVRLVPALPMVLIPIFKILSTERLGFIEDRNNALLFNLLITMLNYWISDLIASDNFLLSSTIDLLEILTKSGGKIINIQYIKQFLIYLLNIKPPFACSLNRRLSSTI